MPEDKHNNSSASQLPRTAVGMCAVVIAGCVLSWLVLRQPALRQGLLTLVPHREVAIERQLLAPRSIFLAGMVLLMMTAVGLLIPRIKVALLTIIPGRQRLLSLFVIAQVGLALAPIINLHGYFERRFGKPIFRLSNDEVMSYMVPQAWPDSIKLKEMFGPKTRIALKPEIDDKYLMPGLAYPLCFYDVYPSNDAAWRSDSEFSKVAKEREIDAILRYTPLNREKPFRVEMIK